MFVQYKVDIIIISLYVTCYSCKTAHFGIKQQIVQFQLNKAKNAASKSNYKKVKILGAFSLLKRYIYIFLIFSQQQHLIELIREKNIESALDYAQTHLAERGEENPEILTELERTLALLAFENPESSPFGELLHPSQRQKVNG